MRVIQVLLAALGVGGALSLGPVPFKVREVSNDSFHVGPDLRIYGGLEAPESKFPFMVFVLMNHNSNAYSQCSASLVTPSWVLVAAHCVYHQNLRPRDILVVGGKVNLEEYIAWRLRNDFNNPVDEQAFGLEERRAINFQYHPKYDSETIYHDVALIELEKPFVSERIKTIPVSEERMKAKSSCTILGWGLTRGNRRTNKLNYAEGKAVSTTRNGCQYKAKGPFICLKPDNRGICQGDSGSPLVCDGKVWGVASHLVSYKPNPDCGDSNEEYYAEIYEDLGWLRSVYGSAPLSSVISPKSVLVCLLAGLWLTPKL